MSLKTRQPGLARRLGATLMEEQLLTGKTALITGGTGGIGRPTALALARLGATTVLVGRDPVRGEAARRFSASAAYSQSKLGVILFSAELSRRLPGAGVTVNAIHPGLTDTNFGRRGGILSLGWTLMKPWAITPDQAAGNLLYLATSPEVAGITGAYFEQQRRVRPKPLAEDLVLATRLWDQLERLTHGASEIVNPRGSV